MRECALKERGVHAQIAHGRMSVLVCCKCPGMPCAGIFDSIAMHFQERPFCSILITGKPSDLDRSGTRPFTATGIEEKM